MQEQFASLGTNFLTVMITGRCSTRSVPLDQIYVVVEESPYLDLISPTVTMRDTVKIGSEAYSSASTSWVSEDYFSIKGYEFAMHKDDTLSRKTSNTKASFGKVWGNDSPTNW